MQVTVEYAAQIKRAAGVPSDVIEIEANAALAAVAKAVAALRPESLSDILLDEAGDPRPSILAFRGEQQARWDDPEPLSDGDTITLLSPVSGG